MHLRQPKFASIPLHVGYHAPCMHVTWMLCEHALSYLVLFRQMNTCNSCYVLASFPGSIQLSVTSSTVRSILEAMESWAGPGNIPYWKWQKVGRGLGTFRTGSDRKLGGAWEHSVLEVTESWAGPGNEAVMRMLLACSCNMCHAHVACTCMAHVTCVVACYVYPRAHKNRRLE